MFTSGSSALTPLQREARYRHIITRMGLMVAFLGIIILALLVQIAYLKSENAATAASTDEQDHGERNIKPAAMVNYEPLEGKPDGRQLFDSKCASCHQVSNERLTGPGLLGVSKRIPRGDWKYKWITNPAGMRAAQDAYALKIIAKSNGQLMTAQNLSREEIDELFRFIDAHGD